MIKINKKVVKESLLIVLIATIIALLFNVVRVDGIRFFPLSKEERIVSDDELFKSNDTNLTNNIVDNSNVLNNNSNIDSNKIDSLSKLLSNNDSINKRNSDLEDIVVKKSFGEHKTVNFEQMKKIVDDNTDNFILIDARRPEEYIKEHIKNAINVYPYSEESIIMDKLFSLPDNKTIIVYCDGGTCDSSHEIADKLKAIGFNKVFIYEGGWEQWEKLIK